MFSNLDDDRWWQNCAHGYHDEGVCECEIGMFFPPGERMDSFDLMTPAGRELDRQEPPCRPTPPRWWPSWSADDDGAVDGQRLVDTRL